MKIHELPGIGINHLQASRTEGVAAPEENPGLRPPSGGEDVIHLSPQARLMHKAALVVAETQDVRTEKVIALKDSLEQGTYEVDAKKVAEKMIAEMLMEKP